MALAEALCHTIVSMPFKQVPPGRLKHDYTTIDTSVLIPYTIVLRPQIAVSSSICQYRLDEGHEQLRVNLILQALFRWHNKVANGKSGKSA